MADPAQAHDSEPTLEQLLAFVTLRKAQAARIQEELTKALDQLNGLVESGELDPQFAFNDWSFNWSAGRTTWDYPGEVKEIEAILKTSKKAAEANGSATARTGAPYWTIRAPKQ
jgi:hypothetical protein